MNEKQAPSFTSRMTKGERIAALVYLPIHILVLPLLLGLIAGLLIVSSTATLSDADINVIYYAVGVFYGLLFLGRFLRRDFDALCDRKLNTFIQVLKGYGLVLLCNFATNALLLLLGQGDSPNDAAILDMAQTQMGKMTAVAVFMAPIVEELLFRGGLFSLFRSRVAAYSVSILLFSLYHVWSYALTDPINWIFLIQYIPLSFLLCRCYEKTNSIWGSIFLHMLINGGSFLAINMLM